MTYIQRIGKNRVNLDNMGIRTRDILIHSPSYEHEFEDIPGMDGVIDLGTKVIPRQITGLFRIVADDWIDFATKRDAVYELFDSKEPFYIIEKRTQHKRWLVKVDGEFDIPQKNIYGDFEINFIAMSGYAESIGTSRMASAFEHIDAPVDYTDYDLRAVEFRIYNPGKTVDPRNVNHFLKITYEGNSENLRIRNLTTGDDWRHIGVTNENDVITLEGITAKRNNVSIFRKTNKQLITIAPGWNNFRIYGAPDAREYAVQANMPRKKANEIDKKNPITFEFKFIY